MSDHLEQVEEARPELLAGANNTHTHAHGEDDAIGRLSSNFLDRGDSLIYAIVGICFFISGFVALAYSFWNFAYNLLPPVKLVPDNVARAIIQLISDLLLVLIIMEVLGTVTHYLKAHATSLRPFLFIGIVSATRGILSVGAHLSVGDTGNFVNDMIELGVNGAVILALGITLKLLGKLVED